MKANGPDADLSSARAYRRKYGFGLNWEQKITHDVGVFSRLGWNNGQVQGWMYNDSNWTASLGVSVKGNSWRRTNDAFGLAYIVERRLAQPIRSFLRLAVRIYWTETVR